MPHGLSPIADRRGIQRRVLREAAIRHLLSAMG